MQRKRKREGKGGGEGVGEQVGERTAVVNGKQLVGEEKVVVGSK